MALNVPLSARARINTAMTKVCNGGVQGLSPKDNFIKAIVFTIKQTASESIYTHDRETKKHSGGEGGA